jgi:hypothetical protein
LISSILVSVDVVKNYTEVQFNGNQSGGVVDMYLNSTDKYNLSRADIRAAYVIDDRTDTLKSVSEQLIDVHIVGKSTVVVVTKGIFSVGEMIGGSGAVLIADGVNLVPKNYELGLEFIEFRAVNLTFICPLPPTLSPSAPVSPSTSVSVSVGRGAVLTLFGHFDFGGKEISLKGTIFGAQNFTLLNSAKLNVFPNSTWVSSEQ